MIHGNLPRAAATQQLLNLLASITDSAGEEIAYHWTLVRQEEDKFKDCWMTDAVIISAANAARIDPSDRSMRRDEQYLCHAVKSGESRHHEPCVQHNAGNTTTQRGDP